MRRFVPIASTTTLIVLLAASSAVLAKLPPLSDEAKAKAAEAAAKAAHGNKVADFQLCKSMDKVAAGFHAAQKQAGKPAAKATDTPACTDPGAFVYAPPAPAAPAAAPGAAPAATPPAAAAAPAATPAAAQPAKK